MILTKVLLYQ